MHIAVCAFYFDFTYVFFLSIVTGSLNFEHYARETSEAVKKLLSSTLKWRIQMGFKPGVQVVCWNPPLRQNFFYGEFSENQEKIINPIKLTN